MIRAMLASVADTAIVPAQDPLGLGNEARMNLPGTVGTNWKWRYAPGAWTDQIADRLAALVQLYER
jgi:4-alpha-glucanotransferase